MIIQCKHLTKSYIADNKVFKAVDDVNLEIANGDFAVILGHSGSGKTTLLSLVGGLTRPDSGDVLILGKGNWSQGDKYLSTVRNKTIGFIFQFASLIPTLTAKENLLLPLYFGSDSRADREQAMVLLDEVGLADKANSFPAQLSGGQQRRIAIARAFMNNPDIILADEPTGDLDEETENDILQVFKTFNAKGMTFVVVTHNSNLAATQENARIMHMKNGKMTESA
ncbi:MAG: ABC transporter ATP-binding protein [Desulfobulbaceae bacterium]|nr:ABC transporter ATP-binding protein [Desulfobulbaceae bacterium]